MPAGVLPPERSRAVPYRSKFSSLVDSESIQIEISCVCILNGRENREDLGMWCY